MLLLVACASKGMAQGPYSKTGNDTVCIGTTKNYGIPADTGSVTYHWSVTPVLPITSGATPNLISITWTSAGSYLLQVYETNSNGCDGDTVSIQVIVNPLPVCSITGTNICPGSTNPYSAPSGMSTYDWSISGNATIPGATNGQTVSVLANNTCGSFTLALTITNANGCTSTCSQIFDVKDTLAPAVTGTAQRKRGRATGTPRPSPRCAIACGVAGAGVPPQGGGRDGTGTSLELAGATGP